MRRLVSRSAFIFLWLVASTFLTVGVSAQEIPMGTQLIDQITLGNDLITLSSPESTQEELPGLGHKFQLMGGMQDDDDPENPTNDTISVDTTGGVVGVTFRNLPPGIKITALDTQLGFKYYFIARTCGGGSPRVSLLIDSDGDGNFNFAAHGHVNPLGNFTACPPNTWIYENLTDDLKRWETTPATVLTPLPCGPVGGVTTCTWDELEMRIAAQFPNHKVLAGFLLDGESCGFPFLPACGEAHYDLVTIENRTLENDQDTVKDGK